MGSPWPAAGPSLRPPGLGGSVSLYTRGEEWARPPDALVWQEVTKRDRGREGEGIWQPRQAGVHAAGHRPPHSPQAQLRSPQLCDCSVPSLPLERPSQAWNSQPGAPDLTKKPGLTKAPCSSEPGDKTEHGSQVTPAGAQSKRACWRRRALLGLHRGGQDLDGGGGKEASPAQGQCDGVRG